MIGQGNTKARRPPTPVVVEGTRVGGVSRQVVHRTRLSAKTRLYDDFSNGLDAWVNTHGKLDTTGGETSDLCAKVDILDPVTLFDYASGYHRTQLLSDNCRAKVTIQDGFIFAGKARVWICGDIMQNRYYGLELETGLLNNMFHIIKGRSTISVQKFESETVELDPGDECEVWYDRPNSTIRTFYNGDEVSSLEVDPTEIAHGPEHRYVGAVMGVDWLISPGVNFASFEAWDV